MLQFSQRQDWQSAKEVDKAYCSTSTTSIYDPEEGDSNFKKWKLYIFFYSFLGGMTLFIQLLSIQWNFILGEMYPCWYLLHKNGTEKGHILYSLRVTLAWCCTRASGVRRQPRYHYILPFISICFSCILSHNLASLFWD